MTPEQLAAHLRLMSQLPITQHHGIYHDGTQGKHYNGALPPSLITEAHKLRAAGLALKTIRTRLRIGQSTLERALSMGTAT